jgi:hypothetical protein
MILPLPSFYPNKIWQERGKSDLLTMEAHAGAKLDVRGETMNIPIPTVEGPQRFYAFDPVFHVSSTQPFIFLWSSTALLLSINLN